MAKEKFDFVFLFREKREREHQHLKGVNMRSHHHHHNRLDGAKTSMVKHRYLMMMMVMVNGMNDDKSNRIWKQKMVIFGCLGNDIFLKKLFCLNSIEKN